METNKNYVDLRSDTVTKPSRAMREAIARAAVGDDVYGEDPTVNELQERVAHLLGKEASLFTPTGTMSNQVAIRTLCRGGELICEADAHIFHYEMAAAAALSGVQLYPVRGERGILRWRDIEPAIRPSTGYFPRTGLICLENTHNRAGGTVVPLEAIQEVSTRAHALGIPVYMDGARLWNASVATGTPLSEYAAPVDALAVCFSKGLGAPAGSCLCGDAEFIAEARRVRRTFGGGMRQVGILAAACLYALDNNVARLAEDHRRARAFAEALAGIAGVKVSLPETNIIMIDIVHPNLTAPIVVERLKGRGVLVNAVGPRRIRAVTHLDVDDAGIDQAVEAFREVLAS